MRQRIFPVPPPREKTPPNQARSSPSLEEERARRDRQALRDIRDFLFRLAVIALVGWILLGEVFGLALMEGESMYPRLRDGDVIFYYRLEKEYYVGDVVTFTLDGVRHTGRIVAQGGDTVDITEDGQLLVNGSVQDEEIFYPTLPLEEGISLPCQLPEDSVFLLCDFRTNGTDSRSYGPVSLDQLGGKVIAIFRRRGI